MSTPNARSRFKVQGSRFNGEPRTRNTEHGTRNSERRKSRGLSLVELVVFIVIVSVGVAGIIGVIDVTTRSSVDPVVHKQALAIGEAVLEEAQLQPFTYCDLDDSAAATANMVQAPAPTFQAAGTAASGISVVSPAWPAHAINDIALLFVESAGGEAATLSTPAGFAAVANSPQNTGTTTNGTRITVFWARATSASMSAPTVADPGDHVYAQILTYRSVFASGNPWDITGGGVKTPATGTVTVTGVTTTVANTRVVQAVARDNDSSAAAFSAQTNVNLTGIAPRSDAGTTSNNGGGFGIWDGVKATAGATGNTTATVTSSINAFLTIALKPAAGGCSTLPEAIGPEAGETRYSASSPFDNVNDFHGFDSNTAAPSGIRNIDGSLIAGLDDYRVTVSVTGQPLDVIGNDADGYPQSLLITVTVTGPGRTTVTLQGYRTRYAPNDLF
ncbi:MAG: type IV pilus modification PilV family protein [Burkholderiales bacterium]